MTYIEEYYEWMLDNPKKVNKKVLTVYEKLVSKIKHPETVEFFNNFTQKKDIRSYLMRRKV